MYSHENSRFGYLSADHLEGRKPVYVMWLFSLHRALCKAELCDTAGFLKNSCWLVPLQPPPQGLTNGPCGVNVWHRHWALLHLPQVRGH